MIEQLRNFLHMILIMCVYLANQMLELCHVFLLSFGRDVLRAHVLASRSIQTPSSKDAIGSPPQFLCLFVYQDTKNVACTQQHVNFVNL